MQRDTRRKQYSRQFGVFQLVKFKPMAVFANSQSKVETELGDLQSEPDVLRLRSIPALSQIFRHWGGERA